VEVQSLLYAALDVGYIRKEVFKEEYQQAEKTKALIGGLKNYSSHKNLAQEHLTHEHFVHRKLPSHVSRVGTHLQLCC
jgi:hypothetical protein